MNRRRLIAIVATTPSGVIGKDGDMPWRLSSDLKRFKRTTMGCSIIMGRKTYESIGRPLPGRRTIVVTTQTNWQAKGVEVANSPLLAIELAQTSELAQASKLAQTSELAIPVSAESTPSGTTADVSQPCGLKPIDSPSPVFIVGGARIYDQLLDSCDEVWQTLVWSSVRGDTHLAIDFSRFRLLEQMRIPAGRKDSVSTEFRRYSRILSNGETEIKKN